MGSVSITPLPMGDYLVPAGPRKGERVPVVAYLVRHPEAMILFDTGFPWGEPTVDDEEEVPTQVFPIALPLALDRVDARLEDVDVVANCHLHADHGGGNFRLGRTPIFVQRPELEVAREPRYTIAEGAALDTANYVVIDGEHEIARDVFLIPTPGHTSGHQSLLVKSDDRSVVLLGQATTGATEFGSHAYNAELERAGDRNHPPTPGWFTRIASASPAEVRFAHDYVVWLPPVTRAY